jgi:cycloeucalenol cycloisomerase
MPLAPHDRALLQAAVTPLALIAAAVAVAASTSRVDAAKLPPPRWFAANPAKRWGEKFFCYYSLVWIAWFGAVVVSGVWERFAHVEYMAVCSAMALPCVLGPLLLAPAAEAGVPLSRRYWVKANAWIAVISYVGNYFWTHYFFSLLGASYTFPSWRINDVPIPMFLATHAYFCTYHSLTTMALRRWWSGHTYARLPGWLRPLGTGALVCAMAWFTAFTEAFTIQGFPYYAIKDRLYLYTVGGIVYGLYFVVSFPMFARLDEDVVEVEAPRRAGKAGGGGGGDAATGGDRRAHVWTLRQTLLDSLAACMLVTILLDLWRLGYLAYRGGPGAAGGGLPWMPLITS